MNATERVIAALRGRKGRYALWTLLVLPPALVGSVSVASDLRRRGADFQPLEPWIWEFSSAVALLAWLPLVLWLDERLRTLTLAARVASYALASAVFCIAHVAVMVALRQLTYGLAGWHYEFGPWLDGLGYEYRKDALTFAVVIVLAAVGRRIDSAPREAAGSSALALASAPAQASAPAPSSAPDAPTFLVRTARGDLLIRTHEIHWIEAQGNYVALHLDAGAPLMRGTLAEMESRLAAHGFIRTHRRALVNRLRMQAIVPADVGEHGVRLDSGQIAPLSGGRRSEVLRLVLGRGRVVAATFPADWAGANCVVILVLMRRSSHRPLATL